MELIKDIHYTEVNKGKYFNKEQIRAILSDKYNKSSSLKKPKITYNTFNTLFHKNGIFTKFQLLTVTGIKGLNNGQYFDLYTTSKIIELYEQYIEAKKNGKTRIQANKIRAEVEVLVNDIINKNYIINNNEQTIINNITISNSFNSTNIINNTSTSNKDRNTIENDRFFGVKEITIDSVDDETVKVSYRISKKTKEDFEYLCKLAKRKPGNLLEQVLEEYISTQLRKNKKK